MSVSEGELKKRLNQHCFKCVADGESDFSDIETILDEAKKEFPKVVYAEMCYNCESEVSCPPCYKFEEWFKKWFGE